MKLPEIPARGQRISRQWAIDLLNYLRSITPRSSGNAGDILVKRTANGTSFSLPGRSGVATVSASPRTLLVYDATAGGSALVGVTFGQINNITPSIGGVDLDASTPPALSVVSGVVYLHATVDSSGLITDLVIENAASVPADTATEGYLVLATVTVAGSAVTAINHAAWNVLQMQVCGSVADEGEVTVFLWGGFGE